MQPEKDGVLATFEDTLYKTVMWQLTSSSQLFWKTGAVNDPFYR